MDFRKAAVSLLCSLSLTLSNAPVIMGTGVVAVAISDYDAVCEHIQSNGIYADGVNSDYTKYTYNGTTLNLKYSNIRNNSITNEKGSYNTSAWLSEGGIVTYPEWFEGTITLLCDITVTAQGYSNTLSNVKFVIPAKNNMPKLSELSDCIYTNAYTDTPQFSAIRYNAYENSITLNKNGAIGVILPCKGTGDQYVTIKLNGNDLDAGTLFIADAKTGNIGTSDSTPPLLLGGPDRSDRPEMAFIDSGYSYQYENGYIYSTYLIPKRYIYTDSENPYVALRIYSSGEKNAYGTVSLKEQTNESRGILGIYISDNECFLPDEFGEVTTPRTQPTAALTAEKSTANGIKTLARSKIAEFSKRQIYNNTVLPQINGMFTRVQSPKVTSSTTMNTYYNSSNGMLSQNLTPLNGLEVLSKAYNSASALGITNSTKREYRLRVISGIDFLCRAQGADGGFSSPDGWIGAGADASLALTSDGRKNSGSHNLTGFGLKSAAQAMIDIYPTLTQADWNTMIDTDCDNISDTPRYQAWAQMCGGARDFLTQNDLGYGHAPNQDMADLCAALRFEYVLEKLNSDGYITASVNSAYSDITYSIWDTNTLTYYFDIAFGMAPSKACQSYWVSPKGLILENFGSLQGGYSGDYGTKTLPLLGEICELSREYNLSKFDTYNEILKNAYHTIGDYFFLGKSYEGYEMLFAEGMISTRNNSYPGTERYPLDIFALNEGYPEAIKMFEYAIAHNHEQGTNDAHFEDNMLSLITLAINWNNIIFKVNQNADYNFTMLDANKRYYAAADEMGKNVVIKNGQERLYASLNWRSPIHSLYMYTTYDKNGNVVNYPKIRLNNRARVHYTTDSYDNFGIVGMKTYDSNISDTVWTEFNGCRYIKGVMTLKYGKYYILMNSSSLMGDGGISGYTIAKMQKLLNIPNGVYADLTTINSNTPKYYKLGTALTPSNIELSPADTEIAGGNTVVLCNIQDLDGGSYITHGTQTLYADKTIQIRLSNGAYTTSDNATLEIRSDGQNQSAFMGAISFDLSGIKQILDMGYSIKSAKLMTYTERSKGSNKAIDIKAINNEITKNNVGAYVNNGADATLLLNSDGNNAIFDLETTSGSLWTNETDITDILKNSLSGDTLSLLLESSDISNTQQQNIFSASMSAKKFNNAERSQKIADAFGLQMSGDDYDWSYLHPHIVIAYEGENETEPIQTMCTKITASYNEDMTLRNVEICDNAIFTNTTTENPLPYTKIFYWSNLNTLEPIAKFFGSFN
ncbi:MAG: hypothetical protein IJT23_01065 [Clostridia bacterium]|nr:hypothetical protein [Clostridia bacterium]